MRRRTGLTALFWRYLLVTGGAVVLLAVLWWGGLSALLRSGFVLPAGTAAGQADGLVRALEAGELTPAELPHYYRWATFDGSAQVVGQRGMNERRLGYAQAALEGNRTLHGFPYQQYHRSAQLPDGTVCLLQFDYSMPYGAPALPGRLPEVQPCATAVLRAAWLAAGALSTRHFAGLLRRDAALLTAATGAIAARRLDVPLDGGARVRELGESLAAMEQLRQALELARAHQERRIEKGAVIIERPDITINLEGAGESITVSLDEDPLAPKAHLLVSELMVLTNAALAAWAKEHGVTLLHRTQDVAIPKEFSGIWQTPLEIARVVKALAPAVLETNPRPHAGLGEAMYAPSTSPLRRYPDMINETQIISLLRDGKPRWSKEELDTLLPLLNAHLDAAGQVQRFRPRYWKLLYFKQQGDRWWPAVITDENDAFVTANMPKEQMIVRARRQFFGERTHPGQELEIRLGKVHPLQNDFQLLETREI